MIEQDISANVYLDEQSKYLESIRNMYWEYAKLLLSKEKEWLSYKK